MNDWGEPYRKEQEARKEKRETAKIILLIILSIIVLSVLGFLAKIVFFPAHVANKTVNVAYGVTDKVLTADNAIYNYEWFKEQEAHIRQCLRNETIAKEEWENFKKELPKAREEWTREDKTEEGSLRNSYYALQKLTNKTMEDYNAKSSMVSRNIFKDNLPSNMSRALYSGWELIK